MKISKLSILFVVLSFLMTGNSYAQNWDYELYPRADIELIHLDAEIKIESDGRIEGDIMYTATLKNSFADTIFFDAASLDIQSVTLNGSVADFIVQDLKLIIIPDEPFPRDAEIQIGINYEGFPSFGIHQSATGTIWTSLLPLTTRHWLPIIDSPRTQLLTDLIITHPAGTTVASNGRKGVSEVIDTEYEQTSFSTENRVSASSLGWALFNDVQTVSTVTSESVRNSYSIFSRRSDPQLYVYTETGQNPEEFLLTAAAVYNRVIDEMDMEIPYGDLQIMILEDDFLETKQTGEGLLFVYENKGSIKAQIERGIVAMFSESVIKSPSWSDSDAARIAEAFLLSQFDVDLTGDEKRTFDPYNIYSAQNGLKWQHFLTQEAPDAFVEGVEIMFNKRSLETPQIFGWSKFSDMIYDVTGRAWAEGFEPQVPEPEAEDTTYSYRAVIEWEEGSTTAEIRFAADSIATDELVTVEAEVVGLSETQVRELTFTGASDGVVLNVPSMLENIKLMVRERNDVVLKPEKPFLFWMYQLRNDDEEERRAEAASGISSYSDNPDIELLLNDVLRSEESDMVIAEVLNAMSEITDGASGTDERFMQFSGSNYAMNIRTAAVEALSNYGGNERVISRLQSMVRQESNETLQQKALISIGEITEPQRFANISESFITQGIVPDQSSFLLNILAGKGAGERAVELADRALSQDLAFQEKKEVVKFLISVDQSPGNWMNRLADLLQSPHPGVRITAAEAIDKLLVNDRNSIIESVMQNEFDERVRRALRRE